MYQQQNFGYYPQQQNPYMQRQVQMVLKGRPVASIEEARAVSIDFDGSIFFFPDLAQNRIYTKQINLDGTATLNMYELKEIPSPSTNINIDSATFITREEFEKFKMDLIQQTNNNKQYSQF